MTKNRIARAQHARDCVQSEWGKIYWDGVIAQLLRKINRLN